MSENTPTHVSRKVGRPKSKNDPLSDSQTVQIDRLVEVLNWSSERLFTRYSSSVAELEGGDSKLLVSPEHFRRLISVNGSRRPNIQPGFLSVLARAFYLTDSAFSDWLAGAGNLGEIADRIRAAELAVRREASSISEIQYAVERYEKLGEHLLAHMRIVQEHLKHDGPRDIRSDLMNSYAILADMYQGNQKEIREARESLRSGFQKLDEVKREMLL